MAIREQRIDIGYGVEKVWRVVYDYRSDPAQRMQTGYVQYDSSWIPVWRPYDPSDQGLYAAWQNGVWQNIYSLTMPLDPDAKKVRYVMAEHNVEGGAQVRLPRVETSLTFALLKHLRDI